jgi:hypothetical protein
MKTYTVQNTPAVEPRTVVLPPQRLGDLVQWYRLNLPGPSVLCRNAQGGHVKVVRSGIRPRSLASWGPIKGPIFRVTFLVWPVPSLMCRSTALAIVTYPRSFCISTAPAPLASVSPSIVRLGVLFDWLGVLLAPARGAHLQNFTVNLDPISVPDLRLHEAPAWRGQEINDLNDLECHSAPPNALAGHGTLPTLSAGPIASDLARHCAAHCPWYRQPQRAILGALGRSRGVLLIAPSARSACSRTGMGGPVPCRQRTCGGRGGARREGA